MNEFILEKETVNILSLDIIKFYHDSAQKRLSDHREQEKNTTERGYKLLSIYLGIVTALIIAGIIASSVIFLTSTTR